MKYVTQAHLLGPRRWELWMAWHESATVADVARKMGCCYSTLYRAAKALDLPVKERGCLTARITDRTLHMKALYKSGRTLQEIGEEYGLSRERIRQLITGAHGLNGKDGGQSRRAKDAKERSRIKRETGHIERYGCTPDQMKQIKLEAAPGNPLKAYTRQKISAKARSIDWKITFHQWWEIWAASGHWHERGRGQGYVMARKEDSGAYSPNNVSIIPSWVNNSVGGSKARRTLPIGVKKAASGRYTSTRKINGSMQYLGTFDTAEEAHAAYLRVAENTKKECEQALQAISGEEP